MRGVWGGVRRKVMLSYLLFVVSLVNHSGFVENKNVNAELNGGGDVTGGLVVKMGPGMNLRVADVRVFPGQGELPTIAPKGSLFEGFSQSRLYAIRYGK
jgi:hypothetical protein